MAKYIDADELRRKMDSYFPFDKATQRKHDAFDVAKGSILHILYTMADADVEPVIHCRDCSWYEFRDNMVPEEQCWWCYKWNAETKCDDFCSYGKEHE